MQPEVTAFFDGYRESFVQGPVVVASFYAEPCVTARMGVVRVNATRADTASLFTEVDKQYRARGFTHAAYELLDVRGLGANGALATLRWAYKSAAGDTIWETTFSYNLYRCEGAWQILVQTMHDP